MGVPFEKISDSAARILAEARYISEQSRDDIFSEAEDDLIRAVEILFHVLSDKVGE